MTNDNVRKQLEQRIAELEQENLRLRKNNKILGKKAKLSEKDPLTGLYNKGKLRETLSSLASRVKREEYLRVVAVFSDIDDFKNINTQYGHESGDVVLRTTAECLKKSLRKHEQNNIYRYGGEEIVFLFYNTPFLKGLQAAERLRKEVERHCKFYKAEDGRLYHLQNKKYEDNQGNLREAKDRKNIVGVTMSFGVASYHKDSVDLPDIIHYSSKAMQDAKKQGKNRSVPWTD
jgi:diguanylate cyclase (GGDEF)-like protein